MRHYLNVYLRPFLICRRGSTIAIVRLKFQEGVREPLKPLKDHVQDGKLGEFKVAAQLIQDFSSMSTSVRPFTSGQSTTYPDIPFRSLILPQLMTLRNIPDQHKKKF